MSPIKDEGDKYADAIDNTLHVFLNGAYNLGPVIEPREATSANIHPGLGVIHATGAGGEDDYTEHGDDSPLSYAVIELDENQIADCSVSYAQYDNIPGLPYHLIPGAYLTNIKVANPAANVEPDTPLCAEAVGQFGVAIEATLEAGGATQEAFHAGALAGENAAIGATIHSRILLKQAYYLTNPAAAYTTVAYVAKGE